MSRAPINNLSAHYISTRPTKELGSIRTRLAEVTYDDPNGPRTVQFSRVTNGGQRMFTLVSQAPTMVGQVIFWIAGEDTARQALMYVAVEYNGEIVWAPVRIAQTVVEDGL